MTNFYKMPRQRHFQVLFPQKYPLKWKISWALSAQLHMAPPTNRQTNTQTNRHTDTQTHAQTDAQGNCPKKRHSLLQIRLTAVIIILTVIKSVKSYLILFAAFFIHKLNDGGFFLCLKFVWSQTTSDILPFTFRWEVRYKVQTWEKKMEEN